MFTLSRFQWHLEFQNENGKDGKGATVHTKENTRKMPHCETQNGGGGGGGGGGLKYK